MSKILNSTAFSSILVGFPILQNWETHQKIDWHAGEALSATILNRNEPIEKQAWWGEMANLFLEQNMCVMKKRAKNNSVAPFVGGSAFSFSKQHLL